MARPLEFKQRVRMREDTPIEISARRLPPLAVPVVSYWLFSGIVIYGIASGALPLRRWLETLDEPDRSPVLAAEPTAPELLARHDPETADTTPATKLETAPAPPAAPAPALLAETPIEEPPSSTDVAPQLAPAPKPEPARLAALEPTFSLPREKRLSVSGYSAGTALMWRTQRDPYQEALPALELPEPPPEESRPALPAKQRRELEPAEDEPQQPPRDEPPPPVAAVPAGSSCEAAVAAYNEEMDLKGGKRVPDLPREAFAAVLDRGTYLSGCGVPDTMRVDICAAVQRGRAVGVTVVTRPSNGRIQSCVARAVRGLRFPSHPKLDVARTRFE